MLPVTHGIPFTKLCLLLYTFLLLAVTCLPFVTTFAGYLYLTSSLILNIFFIYLAIRLYTAELATEHRWAIKTFNFSILYLLLLFTALLIDHRIKL